MGVAGGHNLKRDLYFLWQHFGGVGPVSAPAQKPTCLPHSLTRCYIQQKPMNLSTIDEISSFSPQERKCTHTYTRATRRYDTNTHTRKNTKKKLKTKREEPTNDSLELRLLLTFRRVHQKTNRSFSSANQKPPGPRSPVVATAATPG